MNRANVIVKDEAEGMEYYVVDYRGTNTNKQGDTHAVVLSEGRMLVKAEDIPHAYQIVKDYLCRDFAEMKISRVVKPEVKNDDRSAQ